MRRLFRLLVSSVLSSLSLTVAASGDGALTCDRLVATGNPEYPPYLWQRPDDPRSLMGANQLILDEVSKRLGIPIDLIYTGPWSRAQEEVRAGRVDLIAGAFLTIPRLEYMDYIHPAFLTTRSVVWKRGPVELGYGKWSDLRDLTGSTVINNSFGQAFDSYAREQLSIEPVSSLEQAFRMLVQGRVDYVLYEEYPGEAFAEEMGLSGRIEHVDPPISQEELFLTVSRRSRCNTPEFRQALTDIMQAIVSEGIPDRALLSGLADWNATD